MENPSCYRCGEKKETLLQPVYEFIICESCHSKIVLFKDETMIRHIRDLAEHGDMKKAYMDYKADLEKRLDFIEKDYITKRIKLLYLLDRLPGLKY
jgi:DNA-directed RNA polymerase subunit RPC12/RpoP